MLKKLLVIGVVWPEPKTTAAGVRILELLQRLKSNYQITFVSTAQKTNYSFDLTTIGIQEQSIELNNSSFDHFIKKLDPEMVMFDRFISEEQFGWRVDETCPKAVRILDTEDLHFLRKIREVNYKKQVTIPPIWQNEDIAKREIASIYRCDLSLIISQFEMDFLINDAKIDPHILCYVPFLRRPITKESFKNYPSFEQRNHFMTIGNFRHEPNWHSILHLKRVIWPELRLKYPKSELHIYGAHATEKQKSIDAPENGFHLKGWIPKTSEAFLPYKVCLAPLQFGAGLKGKIVDSFTFGTPVVTTSIGGEGIGEVASKNKFITNSDTELIERAIELFENKTSWLEAQEYGRCIHNQLFDDKKHGTKLMNNLKNIHKNLDHHRSKNFLGKLLSFHTIRSTKYMAKWIEEKNKSK